MKRKYGIAAALVLAIGVAAYFLYKGGALADLTRNAGTTLAGVGVVVLLIRTVAPDESRIIVSKLIRLIRRVPQQLKQLSVANDVEVNIKRATELMADESGAVAPHPLKIHWVQDEEMTADSFFRDGRVIIKMSFSDNPSRNIVESAILYCRSGLLRGLRQFLPSEVNRAVDLAYVGAVIDRQSWTDCRIYFREEALPRELDRAPKVGPHLKELQEMDESGYFTTILLPELRNYGSQINSNTIQWGHEQRVKDLIAFVGNLGKVHLAALDHVNDYVRLGVILVGNPGKLRGEGLRPYVRRMAKCARDGERIVYLVGRGSDGERAIPQVIGEASRRGLVEREHSVTKHVLVGGQVVSQTISRVIFTPDAAEVWNDIEDWPDMPELELSDDYRDGGVRTSFSS